MTQRLYERMPGPLSALAILTKATRVGSATEHLMRGTTPKDYDFIVDPEEWNLVGQAIRAIAPDHITLNTFGGIKFSFIRDAERIEVDIWMETMSHFMSNASKVSTLYRVHHNQLITVQPGEVAIS